MSDAEWKFAKYDTAVSELDSEAAVDGLTESMLDGLSQKGFCVIDFKGLVAAMGEETLKAAEAEVKELERVERFTAPPKEVLQGLLGEEGSPLTCELETGVEVDGGESKDGPTLRKIDTIMNSMAVFLQPVIESRTGLSISGRSKAMLHIATDQSDEEPQELTDYVADEYLSLFLNQQLMIIFFMGPGKAHLEMQPFLMGEDAKVHVVSTEPGMAVILRADMLTHRFYSYSKTVAMSCILSKSIQDSAAKKDVLRGVDAPVAQELIRWIAERMKVIKDSETIGDAGQEWDPAIPRNWQSIMNHTFAKGPQVAVRGLGTRLAATWSPQAMYTGTIYGSDVVGEIPMTRWNYQDKFSPDPEGWKYGCSYAKHGTFMEGAELFDNKPFGLSVFESKAMDPCQRVILECGYECMNDAGISKKKMMRSLIGCYIGLSITEFGCVPQTEDCVGTSMAGSITSNRISFCLGMQGPSYSIDIGAAATHSAVQQAAASLRYQTDVFKPNHTALSGGIILCLANDFYVLNCAAGALSVTGRSMTFDTTANGRCRGEGAACITMDLLDEYIDGQAVRDDGKRNLGIATAFVMSHMGKAAGLTAPSGVAERELLADSIRMASVSPGDIDWVDCHGDGVVLNDAVEVMSTAQSYRGDADLKFTPLGMGAVKTNNGYIHETCGGPQFFRILYGNRFGCMPATQHLTELNPHIEAWDGDQPLQFNTECMQSKSTSSFGSFSGFSATGSMVHIVMWGEMDQEVCQPRAQMKRAGIVFWPGGGGELPAGAEATKSYSICGSWTAFNTAETMEKEDDGVYGFTVTLGVNKFEHFKLYLDGSRQKVLHPGAMNAPKNVTVMGPDKSDDAEGFTWVIDGRGGPKAVAPPGQPMLAAGEVEEGALAVSPELWYVEETVATGKPGDKYRVRLYVAGKWRTLDWKKVEDAEDGVSYADGGTYYVVASWNGWSFNQPLSPSGDGVYSLDVDFKKGGGQFVIVRDEDWDQVFSPSPTDYSPNAVAGPGDFPEELHWNIVAKPGQKSKIEFKRQWDNGVESKSISWTKAA
jgi:polyketide synthase-associated protein